MFLGGVVGALAVIAGAVLLTDLGGEQDHTKNVAATPSQAATSSTPVLPEGVKCSGKDCTGQDPETMGCGGEFAKTTATAQIGEAKVEVRYSEICKAAWARLTAAAPGDTVDISVGGKGRQEGLVNADNDAYTPMTAVAAGTEPKACAIARTTGSRPAPRCSEPAPGVTPGAPPPYAPVLSCAVSGVRVGVSCTTRGRLNASPRVG